MTGVQFGRWTVLYRTENKKNQTYWMCRCACGTERAVAAYCLKSGSSRSCGCLRKLNANVRLDIANKRFGRLVALFPTEKRSHGGSVYWHCRCDCGNEVDVTEGALISGGWKSCGCLKKEIQSNLCKSVQIIDHTAVEWLENRKHRRDNTTGFRGVYRTKNDRYYAAIGFKQRSYYLGMQSIWCTMALLPRIGHGSTKSKLTPHMQRIIPLFSMSRWSTVLCRSLPANRKFWQNRNALVMIDKPEPVPVFYVKKSPENFDAYQKRKTGFLTHIFQVCQKV